MNEMRLIPVRQVFTENQRTAINRYFKKYELNFVRKKREIKRCDMRKISRSCNHISLKDINDLLKKIEKNYLETSHVSIKESIRIVRKMKQDIEYFLKCEYL